MNLEPLPLEKELRIAVIRQHISSLTREELIENFSETIDKLTRMTHQTKQLLAYIDLLESDLSAARENSDQG